MTSILARFGRILFVLALALPAALLAQETRTVSGVVVDDQSGAPVPDVSVSIEGTKLQTITDPRGAFRLPGVPLGRLPLILKHVGYGEHGHTIVVDASGSLDFTIRISSRAIELAPVVVSVLSDAELARRATGNSINVIDRPKIERFAQMGEPLGKLLMDTPGIHFNGTCVEYRLRANTYGIEPTGFEKPSLECRSVSVYVDGVWMPEPEDILLTMGLENLAQIEILSPSEAGVRYHDSARGVLLITTRHPLVAAAPDERIAVTGFDWNEPRPYRWVRVLGLSAIGNAAMVGLTYTALIDCGRGESWMLRRRCSSVVGTGSAIVTGAIGTLVTRRTGKTPGSEGRTVPSFAVGVATASVGYLLQLHGENGNSDVFRTAGYAVLAVGVPLSLTLSDRVFRVLR